MNTELEDFAQVERQELIKAVHWQSAAETVADRCMELERRIERALYYLDQGAAGKARQELLGQ